MSKKQKLKKKKGVKKSALRSGTKKSIVAVACFALAIISLLSFFNGAGPLGRYFLKICRLLFGQGAFLVPLSFLIIGLAVITSRLNLSSKKSLYGPASSIYWLG